MSFGGFGVGASAGGFGVKSETVTGFGATSSIGSGANTAAPASGVSGFGGVGTNTAAAATTTVAGGFGTAPAAGGFGAPTAPAAGGFGTAPAAGGFGAPTAPAAGGFGTAPAAGGFGATPAPAAGGFGTAPAAGGFGATPAPAAGGFGAKPGFGTAPAAGGFGATPAPAAGGFGAKPGFGTAPTAGGFGATGGFGTSLTAGSTGGFGSTTVSGFGVGRGPGFGITGGLGGTAASAVPTAQQYPYTGIKGPGNATSWARDIDFSQVTEQVRFEALPQTLQQHLIELRSFMHAERDAAKKVYLYFNESDGAGSAAGATVTSAIGSSSTTASSSSYRQLVAQMAALKGGGNRAVDLVAVHCNQHEGQARRQLQRLEKFEANIRDYERNVWEPLLEQGLPSSLSGSAVGVRGGAYRPAVSNGAASPFVALVEELSHRMDHVSSALAELEATLVPPGRPLRGVAVSGRHSHHNGSVIPNDAIAQINAALVYELSQLRDSSCVAAHLHSRADIARGLFTRQFGQAEADVLFADTEQQRNSTSTFRRASLSTYFDIPPLPLQAQLPAATPAGNNTMGSAAPTTGFGAGAVSAQGRGFGATSSGGAVGSALTAGTSGAATSGGFGAPATAAAAPAAGASALQRRGGRCHVDSGDGCVCHHWRGGGAGLAAATGGFGAAWPPVTAASAATGAPPSGPSMDPAAPAVAPTAFSLGGSAPVTGTASGGDARQG
ncbi:hypothetical protein JKF63_00597 [Porcisia hertigi]|uniref:Uncharacterized protein n=1 Tax=Porcisia hertigi TaxID=2761500 RepID=A0A836KYH0_9TRYP|nr:hypothetical protein JKF63_00597 [Porcisia hertigi]